MQPYQNWDIVHFIQVVQDYESIWNKNDVNYRCRIEKARAWSEVCSRINEDYPHMKPQDKQEFELLATKKWYNLRDAFIKSLKLGSASKGKRPPYRYGKYMKFLGDLYEFSASSPDERPSSQNPATGKFIIKRPRQQSDSDNDERTYFYGEDEAEEEESCDVFADVDIDVKPSTIVKNVEASSSTANNHEILTVLTNYLQKEDDEDRLFLKSIESMVKKLPHSGKMQFRIEVMNLLLKLHDQYGISGN